MLGPVEAYRERESVPLGGPKPKTLLVALLLAEGRAVSVDRLVDVIWEDDPPARAQALLHTYVWALRRAQLDIQRKSSGYQLPQSGCRADVWEFAGGVNAGRSAAAAGDHAAAAAHYRAALDNWRGAAFGGLTSRFATTEAARLEAARLSATEDRVESELAQGAAAELVDELSALVAEHGLRERLRGQLMTALHRAGQRAAALSCYQAGRKLLIDELGMEPGPELRAVHQRVLTDAEDQPPQAPEPSPVRAVPRQLPPDVADFTGRVEELSALCTADSAVAAVVGKPGSGKSSLAIHAGHRLSDRFADGQLYINLRGAHSTPMDPAEALSRFLRALGLRDESIPATVEERAELYRSSVADLTLLVVLDDAADERQVRPLLPSGRNCRCVITSRSRLGALEAVRHVELRTFGEADSLTLLAKIIGQPRLTAEPAKARILARLCGNLPLAVRIAGARLATRPDWDIATMVRRLTEQRKLLDELAIGDLEVRGSLALSYAGLGAVQRSGLRRLGWLGTPDFAGWLVAALLGGDVDEADDVVAELVRVQLLDVVGADESGVTRYRLHDLVRVFARERAEAEEDHAALVAMADRAARWWLAMVELASQRTPMRVLRPVPADHGPGSEPDEAQSPAAHPAWFEAEQTALVHAVERASDLGLTEVAVGLASALCASSFAIENRFHYWQRTHTAALAAAVRAEDFSGQGLLLAGLGWLRSEQDLLSEAADYYGQALSAYSRVADARGIVITRLMLSSVLREQGRLGEALTMLDELFASPQGIEDANVLARTHHARGAVLTELGRFAEALVELQEAVSAYQRLDDQHGVALVLRSLGITHRAAGRLTDAATVCEQSLRILRSVGDRLMTAYAVQALAKVRVRQGTGGAIRPELEEAFRTCHGMQDGFGQALILRTLGELELAEGRTDEAVRHLEQSLSWWSALSLPLWRARTLRAVIDLMEATDRPEEADRARAEAMEIFLAHGSREASELRSDRRSEDRARL